MTSQPNQPQSEPKPLEVAEDQMSKLSNDRSTQSFEANDTAEKGPTEHGTEQPANTTSELKPTPSPYNPGPPPNGGLKAWMQVLGAFMLFFNTWGILNTFGVYQTYYESGQLFHATSSNISWIGSIQAFLVLLVGAFSGPIYDAGHFRILLIVGSFGVVFGHMMLSLCHQYWQALLAQGFVIGLGGGCLFVPAVAIMPTYFNTRLGMAIGIAASGSSLGGVIYPIIFYRLIDQIGFGWSVRVLGFIALATLLIPLTVMQMRVKPPKARALIDVTAFTDLHFMLFTFGAAVGFIGLYVTFFYISYYGQATGITSASMSFYLVPILNAGSVFGRTLPNILADKIGPLNVITPGAIVVSILLFCMLAVKSAAAIIVVAILFGFFSGIFIALPPLLFVILTPDKSKIGTRIGMGFALLGIGVLCGGPGGGGILQRNGQDIHDLDWTGTWIYGAVTVLVSGLTFLLLRFLRGGFRVQKV
ncbi:MFS general substrate transporter [Polychaeton citri CBS 116435]|uniref:MFS general substrate transporter n=1 Tax=Polychaeton citri CBS 116435 TaxID=1314669 RepID=A0A9P4Q753_9PEZI|nr:MFS general substrate transporter [Polychaeton citri CBS 116435]